MHMADVNGHIHERWIRDIWVIPSLRLRLLSTAKDEDQGYIHNTGNRSVDLKDEQQKTTTSFPLYRDNNSYFMNTLDVVPQTKYVPPTPLPANPIAFATKMQTAIKMHHLYNHADSARLAKLGVVVPDGPACQINGCV